jgi:hypothetical protein
LRCLDTILLDQSLCQHLVILLNTSVLVAMITPRVIR